MEEFTELLPVTSKDQLYHILKTDTFTFCLICFEDINSTSDDVGKHLNSTNHAKSIKCVFRGCNPSLIDDVEDERFVDMILKSVFDISVLLGNETCYVCKRDNYWFCLMCEKNVTAHNLVDTSVKDNIVDHVLSNSHVQKVKEVCFLYRLNDSQDFVLLNKSVVYCSVCKEVMQCKEVDLLKTAVVHLETTNLNHATTNSLQWETSSLVKQEDFKIADNGLPDEGVPTEHVNTLTPPRTKLAEEVKDKNCDHFGINRESKDEIVKGISMHNNVSKLKEVSQLFDKTPFFVKPNLCICLFCKKRVLPVSGQNFLAVISNHFKKSHRKVYMSKSLNDLITTVVFHNDPDKIKLISGAKILRKPFTKLINRNRKVKNNLIYILKTTKDYFCIVCMVSVSPCLLDDETVALENFQNHFNSSSHFQCKKEEMAKVKQALKVYKNDKTLTQLTLQREQYKIRFQRSKARQKAKRAKSKLRKHMQQHGLSQ